MANKATITYNGETIATEEREGNFDIIYNGGTIDSVAAGSTKTIYCKDTVAETDIIIGGKTLYCFGKLMATDVLVAVEKGISNVAILEVQKITSDTYAGTTTYSSEEFILLDIYPKTNGTVKVTYGGLTKTITDTSGAEEPNAQQVFFGKFNGVSDSVETPASGTLTIEGDYYAFACGSFAKSKSFNTVCICVTAIDNLGTITKIVDNAFYSVLSTSNPTFERVVIPETVTWIGTMAFGDYVREVVMLGTVPPEISYRDATDENWGSAFGVVSAVISITVPKGCGNIYKEAPVWDYYSSVIVEASK